MRCPKVELATEHSKSYPGLQVTPIVMKSEKSSGVHRFLWEGIEDNSIEIEEQTNYNVPNVTVVNRSEENFLGYRGSIIRGGGQNRHLVHSFIVPKKSQINVPVQCIQHGRWNPHQSKKFSTKSGDITSSSMRFNKQTQQETWHSIRETTTLTGTVSLSEDYTVLRDCLVGDEEESEQATSTIGTTNQKVNEDRKKSRNRAQAIIKDMPKALDRQIGVYVTSVDPLDCKHDNPPLVDCIEIFGSCELYSKAHKDLISSFAVNTAMLPDTPNIIPVAPDTGKFHRMLEEIENAPWQEDASIGDEKRYEINDPSHSFGESILHADEVLHLMYSSQLQ